MLLSGCALERLLEKKRNSSALCDGIAQPIDELNDALLEDGGPKTVVAGEKVITIVDTAC